MEKKQGRYVPPHRRGAAGTSGGASSSAASASSSASSSSARKLSELLPPPQALGVAQLVVVGTHAVVDQIVRADRYRTSQRQDKALRRGSGLWGTVCVSRVEQLLVSNNDDGDGDDEASSFDTARLGLLASTCPELLAAVPDGRAMVGLSDAFQASRGAVSEASLRRVFDPSHGLAILSSAESPAPKHGYPGLDVMGGVVQCTLMRRHFAGPFAGAPAASGAADAAGGAAGEQGNVPRHQSAAVAVDAAIVKEQLRSRLKEYAIDIDESFFCESEDLKRLAGMPYFAQAPAPVPTPTGQQGQQRQQKQQKQQPYKHPRFGTLPCYFMCIYLPPSAHVYRTELGVVKVVPSAPRLVVAPAAAGTEAAAAAGISSDSETSAAEARGGRNL